MTNLRPLLVLAGLLLLWQAAVWLTAVPPYLLPAPLAVGRTLLTSAPLLLDHAADFHIETIGDTLVFFTPELADFSEPEPWLAIDALWLNAVPAIVDRSERYRDERVPEQGFDRRLSSYQEALTTPGWTWEEPKRRVAKRGKRLAQRKRGPAWSHILPYGRDMIFYLLMNAVTVVAFGGLFYALITLWEAFGGG